MRVKNINKKTSDINDLFGESDISVGNFASLEPAKTPTDPTSPPNRVNYRQTLIKNELKNNIKIHLDTSSFIHFDDK